MTAGLKSIMTTLFAVSVFCTLASCDDRFVPDAELYIQGDASIAHRVGQVESMQRTNTLIVGRGDNTEPLREYQFTVRGARGKAVVTIQITNPEEPSKRKFTIKSIDAL